MNLTKYGQFHVIWLSFFRNDSHEYLANGTKQHDKKNQDLFKVGIYTNMVTLAMYSY